MRKVRITKIGEPPIPAYMGEYGTKTHPNGITNGYTRDGFEPYLPQVGFAYQCGSLITTEILKINDDDTFETKNSIYRLEILDITLP